MNYYFFVPMHFRRFLLFIILLAPILVWAQPLNRQEEEGVETVMSLYGDDILTMMFVGDITPDHRIVESCRLADGSYDFKPLYRFIQPILTTSDLVAGNLNANFAGPPYASGGSYSVPPSFAEDMAKAGFNFLFTANNQCLDFDRAGLARSIKVLDSLGIRHTGTFSNCKERNLRSPSMYYHNGFNVALLNYTFGTNKPGASWDCNVNLMIEDWIKPDITAAKGKNADFVVVYLNWGNELDRSPSWDQTDLAKKLMDAGADLVVGAHSQTVQRIDWIRYVGGDENKYGLAAYSLGNFLSSSQSHYTDGGTILEIKLCRDSVTNKPIICRYAFIPTWIYEYQGVLGNEYKILPVSNAENNKLGLQLEANALSRMKQFGSDTRSLLVPTTPEVRYNVDAEIVNDVAEMIHIIDQPIHPMRKDRDTNLVYPKQKMVYRIGKGLELHVNYKAVRRSFADVRIGKEEMKELFPTPNEPVVIAKIDSPKANNPKLPVQYEYITAGSNGRKSLAEVKEALKSSDLNELEIYRFDSLQRAMGIYDTTYRVQLYALKSLIDVNLVKYPSAKGVEVWKDRNGYYYYLVGQAKKRGELEALKNKLKAEGLTESYIVQYINRKRVNYFPLK